MPVSDSVKSDRKKISKSIIDHSTPNENNKPWCSQQFMINILLRGLEIKHNLKIDIEIVKLTVPNFLAKSL